MLPFTPNPGGKGTKPPDSPIYGSSEWFTLFDEPFIDKALPIIKQIVSGVFPLSGQESTDFVEEAIAAWQISNTRDQARLLLQGYNNAIYSWSVNDANVKALNAARAGAQLPEPPFPQPPALLHPLIAAWSKNHPEQAL